MRKITFIVLLLLAGLFATANYTYPVEKPATYLKMREFTTPPFSPYTFISNLKIKEAEKLLGRKMKLKEKLAFKLYQWKLKKELKKKANETGKKGETAFILGIVALGSLFIPYVGIVAIPCAILAIIFGNKAKKINPNDKKGKTGALLGWITLGVFVVAIAVVIAIVASLQF
jgi:hypothetical protein